MNSKGVLFLNNRGLNANIEELAPVIMGINAMLPHAVVADIGADKVPIANPQAGKEAAAAHFEAWKKSSESQNGQQNGQQNGRASAL